MTTHRITNASFCTSWVCDMNRDYRCITTSWQKMRDQSTWPGRQTAWADEFRISPKTSPWRLVIRHAELPEQEAPFVSRQFVDLRPGCAPPSMSPLVINSQQHGLSSRCSCLKTGRHLA